MQQPLAQHVCSHHSTADLPKVCEQCLYHVWRPEPCAGNFSPAAFPQDMFCLLHACFFKHNWTTLLRLCITCQPCLASCSNAKESDPLFTLMQERLVALATLNATSEHKFASPAVAQNSACVIYLRSHPSMLHP